MSGLKDLAKGGWHLKGKDGKSKESWRGDFKSLNQVSGWLGKGKDPHAEAEEHYSVPIQSLKDPKSFGPPPKNVNYHGGPALPNQTTPDTSGLGAPLSKEQVRAKQLAEEEEARRQAEEESKEAKPSLPYRANTTGLSTSHLPPPPGRKDGADRRSPLPPTTGSKPPSLPPRLPPRQGSASPSSKSHTPEPDAHRGILNQGSLDRLEKAGVSVSGFGIGTKKPQLPPPSSASNTQAPAARQSPASNDSQLGELQSRFSRLTSSASPAPRADSSSQGTTLEQKKAALKTASSFRNNPSSVSLSDAKSAASTANNFRERHGEQVKSGLQSANTLNNKYGIAGRLSSYAGNRASQSPGTTAIEAKESDAGSAGYAANTLGKAKPPPPPPKKRAELSGNTSFPPPTLNLSSKPKIQASSLNNSRSSSQAAQQVSKDLELDLNSLWFADSPPSFPLPSVNRLPGTRSYASSSGWSSNGARKTHTFSGVVRDNTTLATTKVHLTWDASNPGLTVRAEQKHFPPPPRLSLQELENFQERYSDSVASWSESKMGQQVGDGECWTLANDGLAATASKSSSCGQEPCMVSQSLVHGYLIYSNLPAVSPYPEPRGGVREARVARGDIVQLLSAHFKAKNGRSEKWAGAPHHTAVITGVEPNGIISVVEQNVGGVKRVRTGNYDMAELVKGEVRIFRAVGENWVGKLDPTW